MVSIKLVWDGGIIAHAQNAVNSYNEAQTNELQQLNILEEQMKPYGGTNSDNNPSGNWWKLRAGEAEEFEKNGSQAANGNMIACDSAMENLVGFYDMGNGDPIDGLLIQKKNGDSTEGFVCFLGDKTINGYNGEIERGKWYKIGSKYNLYEGPSPIQLSDFANGTIACQSYLERIIASFNH